MSIDINNLNGILLDVLKELGNIGSGNAATALSKMIDKKIDMKVPKVKILDFKNVTDVLGDAEKPVVGVYFEMSGDVIGNIMFVLSMESAKNLVSIIFKEEKNESTFNDMDMSALSEIGNILAASYINSLSKLTGLNLTMSVPSICIDMAGAILSVPAVQFGIIGDKIIFIETELEENCKLVKGDLFLIPDIDSFGKILKNLGVN